MLPLFNPYLPYQPCNWPPFLESLKASRWPLWACPWPVNRWLLLTPPHIYGFYPPLQHIFKIYLNSTIPSSHGTKIAWEPHMLLKNANLWTPKVSRTGVSGGMYPRRETVFMTPCTKSQDLFSKTPLMGPLTPPWCRWPCSPILEPLL